MRRLLLRIAIATGSTAAVFSSSLPADAQGAPPPPSVTVAKPVVREVQETVTFTGRFDASQSVQVKSRVPGFIQAIRFEDGATVKKGELLFAIDPRPYKAAVDQAESAVRISETTVQFATSDLDRAVQLQKTGNITDQLFDQRRQTALQAQAKLAGDRAALDAAKLNLEFTEIRAPFDGRVSRRLVSEGTLIAAADTQLTTIVSTDPIDFYFDVDETTFLTFERAVAKGGGKVEIAGLVARVGTMDEPVPKREARIDFVDNRVDQSSGTMRLRAKVANPDLFLTPGLFGRIVVPIGAPKTGILLPDEAIASDQTRRIVWTTAADGSLTAKPVVPGPKIDGYRLIRSGLDGSENVVVNGLTRIRPGIKVTPQPTQLPPVGGVGIPAPTAAPAPAK